MSFQLLILNHLSFSLQLHAKCFKTPGLLDDAKENLLHGCTRRQMLLLRSVFRDSTSRAQAELPPAIWAEGGVLASEEAWLQRTELHEIEGSQLETTISKETGCGRHAYGSSPLTAPRDGSSLSSPKTLHTE